MNNHSCAGLYIHVPFCIRKCPYCDFYSIAADEGVYDMYTESVVAALGHYAGAYPDFRADTLYFGGGTPLLLGAKRLGRMIAEAARLFGLSGAEITAEGNPGTAREADFADLRACGVNRLSLGLQSANDRELLALGRLHTATMAAESVAAARRAGIENVSLDLMLGVPYQTRESLRRSVRFAAGCGITHLSAYMLKIEEGTPLASSPLRALCAGDDEMAELYLAAAEEAENAGLPQYEISNFARPGRECRHNLKYWRDEEYLGIGPAAHSYMEGRRFFFGRDLAAFMKGDCAALEQEEGPGGGWEEEAMLRLRLSEGLDTRALAEKYPEAPVPGLLLRAAPLEKAGLLAVKDGVVALTVRGFLLSNSVTAELLYGGA